MTLTEAITTGLRVGLNKRIPPRDVFTLAVAGAAAVAGAVGLTRLVTRLHHDAISLLEERAGLERACHDLRRELNEHRARVGAYVATAPDNGVPSDETLERVAEGLRAADAEPAETP